MEKHYASKIIKWQERKNFYIGDHKYDLVTLEHEALVIFCIETGESHIVRHEEKVEITGKSK